MSQAKRSLGDWVRGGRHALHITQDKLGELVSCSGHAIRKIEANQRRPSEGLAQRLAAHLQLSSADRALFLAAARGQCRDHPAAPLPASVDIAQQGRPLQLPQCLPLVGRELELAQLRRWLAELQAHRGRVVLVAGEAGAGKSRILTEALELAAHLELPVAKTKCFEIETGIPYYALVKLLVEAADKLGDARLQGLQDISRAELAAIAPVLAPRLQPLPEVSSAFPESRRVRLFAAINELFDALADSRGLVVAVDDYQWLDSASAQALHSVAHHSGKSHVMIVIASRAENARTDPECARFLSSLKELEHAEPMSLPRLTCPQVSELVQKLGRAADQDIVDRLYMESAGNPFFLHEMLHVVLDSDATTAQTAAGTRGRALPVSLHRAVQRRLEVLSPAARAMLDAASVLGRRFDFDLLHPVAQLAEDTALDALDELLLHGWLIEEDNSYDFAHDKLRESVHQDLSAARRAALHRRAAEQLLRGTSMQPSAQAAIVAEHAEAAGQWSLAIEQRTLAGDHAQQLLGLREAEAHYTSALAHCISNPNSRALRADLLERRGGVRALLSDVDAAAADLREAITESERIGRGTARQHLLAVLGMTYQRADRYAEGAEELQRSLSIARECGDHVGAALANYWLGDIAWTLERNDEAARYFDEVMRAVRTHDLDDTFKAKAYHGLGEVASLDARPREAFENFALSLRLCERRGDRFQQCENLAVQAWMYHGMHGSGEYAKGLVEFDRCMAIANSADFVWFELPCQLGRAAALTALGRFDEALAIFDGVTMMARESGMPRWEAGSRVWLAWCLLDMESPAEALEQVRLARACMASTGVSFFSHHLPVLETVALARLGRAAEAGNMDDHIQHARRARLGYAVMAGLLAQVELLHAGGDHRQMQIYLDELERLALDHGLPEIQAHAGYWRAAAMAAAGNEVAAVSSARHLISRLGNDSRFALRLALLRLVVRLSRGGTDVEAQGVRDMEAYLRRRSESGGCRVDGP